jgi:hypothetical protein
MRDILRVEWKGEKIICSDLESGGVANFKVRSRSTDRLCGLVVKIYVYRSKGPGSIPGASRFSEK